MTLRVLPHEARVRYHGLNGRTKCCTAAAGVLERTASRREDTPGLPTAPNRTCPYGVAPEPETGCGGGGYFRPQELGAFADAEGGLEAEVAAGGIRGGDAAAE